MLQTILRPPIAFLAVLVSLSLILSPLAIGAEISQPVPEGVVLLRNGQVIHGTVTAAGDLYYVAVAKGQMRLHAAEVEFVCRNLQEGYRQKRATIRIGKVEDHLRLAQWALRHGLLQAADAELADAAKIDSTHPMISVLQRRLSVALRPTPTSLQPTTLPKPATVPTNQGPKSPSAKELRLFAKALPPGTVERFTQQVQPLLLNRCSAAACHGNGSEASFRLQRATYGRSPSGLVTQRNLHATLQWVDRDRPDASRLLTEPLKPHGNAELPAFSKHDAIQYGQLVYWVRGMAGTPQPTATATPLIEQESPSPAASLGPQIWDPVIPKSEPSDAVTAAGGQFPDTQSPQEVMPAVAEIPTKSAVGIDGLRRGNPLPGFVPSDPFDPEIFNRRYFGK